MTDTTTLEPAKLEKLGIAELRRIAKLLDLEPRASADKTTLATMVAEGIEELPNGNLAADSLQAYVEEDPMIEIGETLIGRAPKIRIEDIHWRIDSKPSNVSGDKGRARYISYIDARTAADYLDEWVGPDRWETAYQEAELFGNSVLWCHLTLFFPDRTVRRSDVSTFKPGRGGTEEERAAIGTKGVVSDAFKRAAVSAGIGRNVYDLPEIWAECRVSSGKAYPTDNAMREIAATLRNLGYDADSVVTDAGNNDEEAQRSVEAAHPETPTNWTAWARRKIYENLDRDRDRAAEAYRVALDSLGLDALPDVDGHPDPFEIPDEETARKAVAAAMTSAIVDTLDELDSADRAAVVADLDAEGRTGRLVSEEVAHAANEYVAKKSAAFGAWVEWMPDDGEHRWTREARRATIVATKGDLTAATQIYSDVIDSNGWPEPLSQENAAAYIDVLKADLG